MTDLYAWCLDCGQSFSTSAFPVNLRCFYCDAPSERLVPADRPIKPAVIDGRKVSYSVVVKTQDGPRSVSLAIPYAAKRKLPEPRLHPMKIRPLPPKSKIPKPDVGKFTLDALEPDQCHYPCTNDRPYLYCGDAIDAIDGPGRPYCRTHMRVVYRRGTSMQMMPEKRSIPR